MLRHVWKSVRHAVRALLYGVVGGFVVAVVLLVFHLNGRPDLKVWHTADLDEEFTADSSVESFADYLALEDRLFAQLDEAVYQRIEPEDQRAINRYNDGSLTDPRHRTKDWNRSFVLPVEAPRVGVLLIHGMSDSPYSMRSLGERLHSEGAWVLGLRVPGHGTAPSGLVDVEWQDMSAAVRLAMTHLHQKTAGRPLVIVGYSNGGALAVEYALEALTDDGLPPSDQLILLSPEIGITKFAALAVWQERLGHLLGMEKLAWNSILPEYDPYKYVSFALNAGKQAYLITQEVQSHIAELGKRGKLKHFPPILAFQSVVDATVTAPVLVTGLFDPLPGGNHELVLFDLNHNSEIEFLLKRDPGAWLQDILRNAKKSFTVSVVTNEGEQNLAVVLRQRRPGETEVTQAELGLSWPRDLYSLAHVALPFPPDDPVYGGPDAVKGSGIPIGNLALRGERGVLEISASDMLRLRWNPFHSYIEERSVAIIEQLKTVPH
jgi:alpha-beta hydrolase superfamily lysophospholipase